MGSSFLIVPPSPEGDITMKTDQMCPSCGEYIVFTEEVVLLQVVQPQIHQGSILLHPVLDDEGDFLYEPYFIQFSPCWERMEEWLEEQNEDVPPVPDPFGPIECRYCRSNIREWEYCGSVTMGEFHISKRNPEGRKEEDFVPSGAPDVICLYCLYLINEGNIELWDAELGGISQNGECGDCLQARCWRNENVLCECPCHEEEEHDE